MEQSRQDFRTPPNLVEHLTALVQVVRLGGVSAAARSLGRSVSTVSYSLAQLEKQVGYPLIERGPGRAVLTERGQALFAEARAVVESGQRFAAHARLLEKGREPVLRILTDVLLPRRRLTQALATFAAAHPLTRVQLFNASLDQIWERLRDGPYDLAVTISTWTPTDMETLGAETLRLSPFCAPDHPLAALPGPLTADDFRAQRQVYFVGGPEIEAERVGRILGPDLWTSDDVEMVRRMVVSGIAWCFGVDGTFEEELEKGQVIRLDCADARMHPARNLCLAWPMGRPPGILGRAFSQIVLDG